jgi:hypothetical protein
MPSVMLAGDEPPLERTSRGTSRLLGWIADCRLQIVRNAQSAICNLQSGRLPRETASGGTALETAPQRKTATESSPADGLLAQVRGERVRQERTSAGSDVGG